MYPIKVLAGLVVFSSILFGCGGGGGGDATGDSTLRINTAAGTGGSVSPASAIVNRGATANFTVTPDSGFVIASVTGCGGSLSGNTYATGPVTADCTITASFSLSSYLVTATAGAGGSISPASTSVDHGATADFTVTPDPGFVIASVAGCGGSLSGNTYATGPVTADCTITASFSLSSYLVTATAGAGGSISPTSTSVDHGATANFTVTPDSGFVVASVAGCGGSLSGNNFTTGPVTASCTVSASFQPSIGISLTVSGIPASSTKLVAVVDGANGAFRHTFAHSGGGQASTVIGVPAGTGYRVRVIALGGGGTFPSVLAGGYQQAVDVVDGAATDVSITLSQPGWTVDPSTPTQVTTGSTFEIVMEIDDPADFFDGRTNARLYWDDQPFASNLTGIQQQGTLQQIAVGRYRFSVTLTAPTTTGTIYYQFAEASGTFNDPAGSEAPFLALPDLNTNQTPLEIQVTL